MPQNPPQANFGNKLLSQLFQVKIDIDMPVEDFVKKCKSLKVPVEKAFMVMYQQAKSGTAKVQDAFALLSQTILEDTRKNLTTLYGKDFADAVVSNIETLNKNIVDALIGNLKDFNQLSAQEIQSLSAVFGDLKQALDEMKEPTKDVTDILNDLNKALTTQSQNLQKVKPSLDDIIKDMETLGDALEEQGRDWQTLKEAVIGFGGVLGMRTFWDLAKDVEKMGADIMLTGRGMEISRKTATALSEDILKLAKTYQVGAEEIGEIIGGFARLGRTEKEIKGLVKTTLYYKNVLGLSTDQAVDFIDTQTRILGLSPKGIENLGSAMLGYAKATKITTEELVDCINAHKDFIRLLKKGEIRETAEKEIMAVSSLFKELGVAPSELSGILDSIIDITDEKSYLMLSMFSSFGERARDMVLAGKPEEVVKDMAKNISRTFRGMSQREKAFWINYYSEMTGISKSMLTALADTTEENIDAVSKRMAESIEKTKPLRNAWDEWRKTSSKLQERLKDLVNTALAKFVLPALTFFGKILNVVVGALSKLVDIIGLVPKPVRVMTFALLGAIAVYTTLMSTFFMFRGTLVKLTAMWLKHGGAVISVIGSMTKRFPILSKVFGAVMGKMGMYGKAGIGTILVAMKDANLTMEDRVKVFGHGLKALGKEAMEQGKNIGASLKQGLTRGLNYLSTLKVKIPFLDKIIGFGSKIGKWIAPIFNTAGKFILTGLRFIGKVFWTGLRAIPILGWILLGISLLPLLNKYILEPLIKVFGGEKALEKWKKFWNSIFGWAINIGKQIWGGIKEGFGSVFNSIKEVFSGIWDSFKEIWGAFKDVFAELKGVFDMVLEMFGVGKKEGGGFGDVIKVIIDIIVWGIKIAFAPLVLALKVVGFVFKLIAKGVKFFASIFSGLVFLFKEFLQSHPGLLKLVKVIFMFASPLIVIIRIVKGVINSFKIFFKLIKDIFSGKNIFEAFGNAFKSVFNNLIEILGLKKLFEIFGLDKIKEFGKMLFEKIKNIFISIGKWLYEALKNVFPFNLLFGGMDLIKGLGKKLGGLFKGLFGGGKKEVAEKAEKEPKKRDVVAEAKLEKFKQAYEKLKMLREGDKSGLIAEEIKRLNMKKATAPVEEQANLQKAIDRLCNIMNAVADNTKTQVDLKKKELTDKEKELPEPLTGLTDMLANFNTAQQLGG